MFSGAAGEAFAVEFMGFLKTWRDLPNPDLVIMNPDSAKVPTRPDSLYALAGALAERASVQNVDNIIRYAARIPDEFAMMMVKDIVTRDPSIASRSPAVTDWCHGHSYILN